MSLFCLVHGANQGTWCWERLIPELEARGHQAITMDLPIDEPSTSLSNYADVVIQSLQDVDDQVILVGHSMAGMIIPLVAMQRPIRKLMFLCALLPQIGMSGLDQFYDEVDPNRLKEVGYKPPLASLFEQLSDEPNMYNPASLTKKQVSQDETIAKEICFHDCEPDVAHWAISKLRDMRSLSHLTEVFPLQTLPNVECDYIVCMDDRIISPTWSKYAARKRLKVEAIELPGGHYPHISHPIQLAEVLTKST
ncbi:MAG: alpha/beta hydrolase [Coleofasciculaceae cyanobacterium]|jgi:pimeloyl-ACP methyl ester carboxylesterase